MGAISSWGVRLSNRVEVGAGSTIDRGAIQDTVIGEGTKISKAVHISHNVRIGKHCLITGAVSIAGSTIIGDHVWISPGATILKLSIGDHAFVAIGATVTQSIPDNFQAIGRKIISKKLMKLMNSIEELIRETLMLPSDAQINDQTTPHDIPAWDSLGHINIITAIEDEYDIEIAPEQNS